MSLFMHFLNGKLFSGIYAMSHLIMTYSDARHHRINEISVALASSTFLFENVYICSPSWECLHFIRVP